MKYLFLFFSLLGLFPVFAQEDEICGVTVNSSLPVGKLTFMCYNLGASPNMTMQQQMDYVRTDEYDATVLGDLYQWGRNTDGHEKRTSDTTSALSLTDISEHGKFVLWSRDWREPRNDSLWGVPKTANDPCPEGWRIPTIYEWNSVYKSTENVWVWNDKFFNTGTAGYKISTDGGITFSLFLPSAFRRSELGISGMQNAFGYYWSSTVPYWDDDYNTAVLSVYFTGSSQIGVGAVTSRSLGYSCRCIKEYEEIVCDTTITIINDTICYGERYKLNGKNYNKLGTYRDTLRTVHHNCDSIVMLNLTVNPLNQKIINATICKNETYDFYGKNLNIQGIYHDTLQAVMGCDTVVTFNLTIHSTDTVSIHESILVNNGYNKNDFNIPIQNSITSLSDTLFLKNSNDCDSIVILILDVNCPLTQEITLDETICQGESYNNLGFILPSQDISGNYTYRQELTDMYGCDSTVTLHLTVKPFYEETFTARVAVNEPYNANGFSIPFQSKPGLFTFEYNRNDDYGCDSVVTLYLTVFAEIIPDSYFSPDGNGENTSWNIKNIENFEVTSVEIFDRSGKLLVKYTDHFIPWDGTYLGKKMPSTDYWYIITLSEIEKQYVGHFTLIR